MNGRSIRAKPKGHESEPAVGRSLSTRVSAKFQPRRQVSGQATFEYAILLIFASLISLTVSKHFSDINKNAMESFAATLEKELTHGSFPEARGGWEN